MPSHNWSDTDFDWNSLYQAQRNVEDVCKWIRVGSRSKEKYGTIRWYLCFFNGSLHCLTHPGYVSTAMYPRWLNKLVNYYRPLRFLCPIIVPIQKYFVKKAIEKQCKLFPHIVKEIIADVPSEEYLPKHLIPIYNSLWRKV